jgi:glycosyltransferase involved in cell wall biosynthesis
VPLSKRPTLAIVVPCYNEEEILPKTHSVLTGLLKGLIDQGKLGEHSFVCFVDDGSRDRTWAMIHELTRKDPLVRGLKLSRNFGHQNALLAGMLDLREEVDCIVTIDADLQDDTTCIEQMLDKYQEGYRIVYGIRNNRDSDTFSKRTTAQMFYKIMQFLGVNTIYNHADFRLVDRQALGELAKFGEVNMFLRGIFPQLGFKWTTVSYGRQERTAGETKYPFRKMLAFAWDGITSFSGFPLRMIFLLGCVILAMSFLLSGWAMVPVIQGRAIQGWASTVIPMFIFAGLQMISVGIVGEYMAKVYQEIKARPRYIIEMDARWPGDEATS